ncbi:MAG: phosphoglycerate dehydrogenase [Thermodesulfovibrionia bacterium]|nr:phosphoglycerate dehydrogenase [Thermodesulfovibrionia bacterium]
MKVLISTSSFGTYDQSQLKLLDKLGCSVVLNPYKRKLAKQEALVLLKDCAGVIAGTEVMDREVLQAADKLRVISRVGVGIDNIDLAYAKKAGILVFRTPEAVTESVAELAVGLMLDCLRGLSYSDREMRDGRWKKHMGSLLYGKTVGIIGLGRIGSRIAGILKKSFGCNVVYYDTYKKTNKFEKVALNRLFRVSDIISFNSSSTEVVLDSESVRKLKKGVIIINTSRANLIDEAAIIEALKDGTVAFAAFDVFNKEPYSGGLRELPNVVLTPHIGSYAREARIEMERQAADNLIKGFKKAGLL